MMAESLDRGSQGQLTGLKAPAELRLELAARIDHTLLKPEATPEQIIKLCEQAKHYNFCSVCVNGWYVELCVRQLAESMVKVCTVAGFPLGATTTDVKLFETASLLDHGAHEVDMVINIGALRAGEYGVVQADIAQLAELCHKRGALLKVIHENCLLTDEEKVRACELSCAAGADFVKTSTGFLTGGATVEDVRLMRRTLDGLPRGRGMGVKAAGKIGDTETALAMIAAGATRLGLSKSVEIIQGVNVGGAGY